MSTNTSETGQKYLESIQLHQGTHVYHNLQTTCTTVQGITQDCVFYNTLCPIGKFVEKFL